MNELRKSTLLTLSVSEKDLNGKAEDGVISFPLTCQIRECIYETDQGKYLLLFSENPSEDPLKDESTFRYAQLVNFPLLVRKALNDDLDGFILNPSNENITIPRGNLRNFMKGFDCPVLDDYSMYAFTIPGR
jgi:hypothetical protein